MAVFRPSLQTIKNFKTPPTAGEWTLLSFLDKYLDNDYEVYFQPHLNGLLPDVVVVHKNHGVLVIEVKDYHLGAYAPTDDWHTWQVFDQSGREQLIRSPFYQAKLYKDALCQMYFRILNDHLALNTKYYSVIETGVFFSEAHTIDTVPFVQNLQGTKNRVLCWCKDDLTSAAKFFSSVTPFFYSRPSKYFTDEIYEEIVRVLQPSEYIQRLANRKPIKYTKEQKRLVQSKPHSRAKVRGVAGSGKTEVLAMHAVNAARRTDSAVLIVVFNITLCNYIHDRISRLRGDIPWSMFSIIHYNALAKYFDRERNYKTILVDEVQDFKKEWILDLRENWLDKRGNDWEILFFGDEKQNLYHRDMVAEDNGQRPYTGVPGNWNKLKESFRLESTIADFATAFEKEFAADKKDVDPILTMSNIFDDSLVKYYHQDTLDVSKIYQLYRNVVSHGHLDKRPNDNDIVFLGTKVEPVRKLDYYLRTVRHFDTSTTFETEEEYQEIIRAEHLPHSVQDTLDDLRRPRKFKFYPEAGKLKLSTIHSFKGWEMETVFLLIDNTSVDPDAPNFITPELLYTAITRAIKNLIIIEYGEGPFTPFFQHYFLKRK